MIKLKLKYTKDKKLSWHIKCPSCGTFEDVGSCSVRLKNKIAVHCSDEHKVFLVSPKKAIYKKMYARILTKKSLNQFKYAF